MSLGVFYFVACPRPDLTLRVSCWNKERLAGRKTRETATPGGGRVLSWRRCMYSGCLLQLASCLKPRYAAFIASVVLLQQRLRAAIYPGGELEAAQEARSS